MFVTMAVGNENVFELSLRFGHAVGEFANVFTKLDICQQGSDIAVDCEWRTMRNAPCWLRD